MVLKDRHHFPEACSLDTVVLRFVYKSTDLPTGWGQLFGRFVDGVFRRSYLVRSGEKPLDDTFLKY